MSFDDYVAHSELENCGLEHVGAVDAAAWRDDDNGCAFCGFLTSRVDHCQDRYLAHNFRRWLWIWHPDRCAGGPSVI